MNGDVDLEVVMRTATGTGGTDDLGLVGIECDEKAEYFDLEIFGWEGMEEQGKGSLGRLEGEEVGS